MEIVAAKELTHEFPGRDENGDVVGTVKALRGVSLQIEKGEFAAILGHNGSGKSTLAKHINALLFPTGGDVVVCGHNTKQEENLWEIRKSAGMVFQNPDNQIVATVVEEDVGFGPENLGVPTDEIWERVKDCLKKVGMYAYRKHSPNKLSGGQKQRVAVAGVMAMKPECIILDEPTAMLDPKGRAEVIETVRELNRTEGITVLLITHYMDEVVFADRVFVMNEGELVMQGTPRQVFARADELKALRLSVPLETELSDELRKLGWNMPEAILSRDEFVSAFLTLPWKKTPGAAKDVKKQALLKAPNPAEAQNALSFAEPQKAPKPPLLELADVSYTYSAGTAYEMHALSHVDLSVGEGEFIGLIGHTGSGKSTLIQHLNGLEKPTEGTVRYQGKDIHAEGFSKKWLRGQVGLVFQYPEYQLFESTVLRDVCFGPKNLGLSEEEVERRAKAALELVKIPQELWESSPFDLSGGQKRRVAIAGVLAMRPKVLVLDEPTAGLDPRGHDEILGQIETIHRQTGMTVVLVSHSMEDVAQYADRLVVMNHGKVAFTGAPRQVFSHVRELEHIGLAVPNAAYLMTALREAGVPVGTDVFTVEEAKEALLRVLP
ncbi:MAG: energy-coupling factor transporter ATPase [Lachnospiraceae bacterium]|nr:energy-coupling factor transporter ATPase [Lachnospiraceae bacterium]